LTLFFSQQNCCPQTGPQLADSHMAHKTITIPQRYILISKNFSAAQRVLPFEYFKFLNWPEHYIGLGLPAQKCYQDNPQLIFHIPTGPFRRPYIVLHKYGLYAW